MKVTFKNIGPVKEAKIDLSKKLNILCGPNNTGKTYIAYCLYFLNKLTFSKLFSKIEITELKNIFKYGKATINLVELYKNNKEKIRKIIEEEFNEKLQTTFGLDKDSMKKIFPNPSLNLELDNDLVVEKLITENSYENKINFGENVSFDLIKSKNSIFIDIILTIKGNETEDDEKGFFSFIITSSIIEIILKSFFNFVYIAPVERNSIYTFSKELSLQRNILVDKMLELKTEKSRIENPFDLVERRATRYPLPIRDGLEISEDLANFKKRESKFEYISDMIEKKILEGKIIITREGEVNFQPNRSKTTKLPIHLTGSIVKSLSSLVIYFRHLANEGDLFIFDEPELNLHPDAQIIVARLIAQIINTGFKVLINTHSSYIIREINNLIMLSKLDNEFEEIANEYGYTVDNKLNPEEIGAYLFKYKKNNVTAKELEITEDGFEVETIDDIINELNSRSQELYFRLKDK